MEATAELLDAFIAQSSSLSSKLGCYLVQLPPSLQFDPVIARGFFNDFSIRAATPIACEPRHPSWFDPAADDLLGALGVTRVAADPARTEAAALPGGQLATVYYRLHGSPKMYYSAYTEQYIESLAARIGADRAQERSVWCIFDNTTLGAAARNGLELLARIGAV